MNKRINILHWPGSYPDKDRNQAYAATFVREHIHSTSDLVNNRVLFISSEDTINKSKWHERTDYVEDGVPVTRLYFNRKINLRFSNIYIRLVVLFYLFDLILFKKFYPRIIHLHFHQGYFWARLFIRLFRIPYVVTEHWSAFLGWPDIGKARYKRAGQVFNHAKKIIAVSHKLQQGIVEHTGIDIADKSTVIPNAVDTKLFSYTSNPPGRSDLTNIVYIGRNAEEKDLPTLFAALSIVRKNGFNIMLHMVSDGDYYNIDSLIAKHDLKDHITRYGKSDKGVISNIIRNSHLLMLTSTVENSPCVIGEAHCCGVPVVATDVGGVKELIIEGGVVEKGNPEAFAAETINILKKNINHELLAQKAAAKFGYENIGKQHLNLYQQVCAE